MRRELDRLYPDMAPITRHYLSGLISEHIDKVLGEADPVSVVA